MSKANNPARIGFIDVLTGFLCSTALLMIIIAYSQNAGKDIAGGSRDYLFYQIHVTSLDGELKADDAYLQFYITTPNGYVVANNIGSQGPVRNTDSFYELNEKQSEFFVWGPSYIDNSNEVVYNVYGVGSTNYNPSNWKIEALYYDHKLIEEASLLNDEEILKRILDSRLQIKVFAKTLAATESGGTPTTLRFGNVVATELQAYE